MERAVPRQGPAVRELEPVEDRPGVARLRAPRGRRGLALDRLGQDARGEEAGPLRDLDVGERNRERVGRGAGREAEPLPDGIARRREAGRVRTVPERGQEGEAARAERRHHVRPRGRRPRRERERRLSEAGDRGEVRRGPGVAREDDLGVLGPAAAGRGEERVGDLPVEEEDLPRSLVDGAVRERLLDGDAAVDLAAGRRAEVVPLRGEVAPPPHRVRARRHGLRLQRLGLVVDARAHLAGDDPLQVVLETDAVDHVERPPPRRADEEEPAVRRLPERHGRRRRRARVRRGTATPPSARSPRRGPARAPRVPPPRRGRRRGRRPGGRARGALPTPSDRRAPPRAP